MTQATYSSAVAAKSSDNFILWFEDIGINDIPEVGGKNASLGEMIQQLASKGVRVPSGFAATSHAYRYFIQQAGLEKHMKPRNHPVVGGWGIFTKIFRAMFISKRARLN